MLKRFRPLLLGGVLAIAGCAQPAPGPAIPDADSNAASNAAANAASSAAISKNKTVARTDSGTLTKIPVKAQKVTIELPDGYKKNAATIKVGTPVALTFVLKKDADCGNTIAVPAAKWQKKLKVGESATVVYTPQKSGELKFACSMDMMKGTITVQ